LYRIGWTAAISPPQHWVAPQLALLEERIKMLEDAAKLVAETKRGRKHA